VQAVLQRYKELQDIIAILGMDELSEEDKPACTAREKSSGFCRNPSTSQGIHRQDGKIVPLKDPFAASRHHRRRI